MAPRRAGVPLRDLLSITLKRVVPAGLVIGAAMEGFMYYTNFWDVAKRNEAERRVERKEQIQALKAAGKGTQDAQ